MPTEKNRNLAHFYIMKNSQEKANKRRLQGSSVTTVISITLVLWMIGMLGMVILHSKKLSDLVKENIGFTIMLNDDLREADIRRMQKELDAEPFVKSTEYVTKEQAAKNMEEILEDDFIDFLGYTLPPSIEVRLSASYANNDSLRVFANKLMKQTGVREVVYQEDLVQLLNKNIRSISIILLGFSAILLAISLVLVNNTIRLTVFARRFLIRSMQLVGATQGFIRRPFIRRGFVYGFISALLAIGLIILSMKFAMQQIPELSDLRDDKLYLILFAGVILLGLLFSWLSTFLAVRKYLRIKTDALYYF